MFIPSAIPTAVAVGMIIAGWLVTLLAAFFIPVPRPVAEMSAFAARGMWMVKMIITVLTFGAAATYGASAGIALQAHASSGGPSLDAVNEWLVAPRLAASPVLLWFFGMWLSFDLLRARTTGRRVAAERCVVAVATALHWVNESTDADLTVSPRATRTACAWATDALEQVLRPGSVVIFGYFGPAIAYVVASGLINSRSAGFG